VDGLGVAAIVGAVVVAVAAVAARRTLPRHAHPPVVHLDEGSAGEVLEDAVPVPG
jgi:hypothetical protein